MNYNYENFDAGIDKKLDDPIDKPDEKPIDKPDVKPETSPLPPTPILYDADCIQKQLLNYTSTNKTNKITDKDIEIEFKKCPYDANKPPEADKATSTSCKFISGLKQFIPNINFNYVVLLIIFVILIIYSMLAKSENEEVRQNVIEF